MVSSSPSPFPFIHPPVPFTSQSVSRAERMKGWLGVSHEGLRLLFPLHPFRFHTKLQRSTTSNILCPNRGLILPIFATISYHSLYDRSLPRTSPQASPCRCIANTLLMTLNADAAEINK